MTAPIDGYRPPSPASTKPVDEAEAAWFESVRAATPQAPELEGTEFYDGNENRLVRPRAAAPELPGWGPNQQRAALGLRPEPELVATLTEPVDSERWIAKGCLRPNTMMLIVGARGDRKSHLRKDLELALATGGIGGPLWGAFDIASLPLRVLVLDEDNGPPEEYRRDQEHLKARGLERDQLTNLWRLSWSVSFSSGRLTRSGSWSTSRCWASKC